MAAQRSDCLSATGVPYGYAVFGYRMSVRFATGAPYGCAICDWGTVWVCVTPAQIAANGAVNSTKETVCGYGTNRVLWGVYVDTVVAVVAYMDTAQLQAVYMDTVYMDRI